MKTTVLSIIPFVLVLPVMAETTNEILYKVRLANGAAPTNVLPPKAVKWEPPSLASNKISAQSAGIAAVAWAGGLSSAPGGFYNASNVRVDSVRHQDDPVPYYLVRMTGQVGNTRQTLYAAVLEDGRIIQPTLISTSLRTAHARKRHH
jgi:hypothetical protein